MKSTDQTPAIITGKSNALSDIYLKWIKEITINKVKTVKFVIELSRYANFIQYDNFKKMIQNDSVEYDIDYSIEESVH